MISKDALSSRYQCLEVTSQTRECQESEILENLGNSSHSEESVRNSLFGSLQKATRRGSESAPETPLDLVPDSPLAGSTLSGTRRS